MKMKAVLIALGIILPGSVWALIGMVNGFVLVKLFISVFDL